MDSSVIFAGFAISTVGLSVFIYGKRQQNAPSLVAGMALMACPFALSSASWMVAAAFAIVAALRFVSQRAA